VLRILNDCLQGSVEGLGFLFAATDECMADKRRGLFSYEALATRLARNRFAGEQMVDMSGPVLGLANLTPEDCYVLLHNIRRVFTKGQGEETFLPNEAIVAYLESCQRRLGSAYYQTPRETIKDFVGLLNVLQQNVDADWKSLIADIRTSAVSTEPDEVPDDDAGTAAPGVTVKPSNVGASKGDDLVSFKL